MQKIQATSAEAQSADLMAANIAQLKALFPELITEGANGTAVNVDVLKALVGDQTVTEVEEKYGLNWHGKRRARQLALAPSTGTLRPCPEESVDWDTTQNLMIEGDNLEVLKLLQKSYAGKVKLIYIDPPYNTGKDFVYPDDFRDNIRNYKELTGQIDGEGRARSSNTETSGRFHTDWLNMIYPRVKLARSLLTHDGVILISIDDHEIENLRRVFGEIFGEENFIACMIWEKGRKNDAKFISGGHEYVLVYAKSLARLRELKTIWREEKPGAREIWEQYLLLRTKHGDDDRAIETDLQAWFSALDKKHPAKKWSRYKRVDANGPWRDRDISWPGGGGPRYDVNHPKTGLPCKVPERGWIYSSPEEMTRQIKLGLVEFRADHTEPPFRKAHIKPIADEAEEAFEEDADSDDAEDGASEDEEEFATQVRGSYFYKQSQVCVKFLRKLLGAKVFNNPKDHFELARLIDYATANDQAAIVMDFFAGSGSTAHAVMDLNAADGGKRRYVMVQLPEPLDPSKKDQKASAKYCDKIGKPRSIAELTKERLRRVAAQIRADNPTYGGDTGFRVFRLDTSNLRVWNPKPSDLQADLISSQEHLLEGRSNDDILCELLLKLGLDLCMSINHRNIGGSNVYSVGGGVLMTCLVESISSQMVEPIAEGIVAWHKELAPAGDSTCVFRDSAFVDDVAKTNMAAILAQNGIVNVRSL
ncbi:site-specific DNA-methyltransferase [Massilia genomosp. 1]|uniref:site-specific DNA-methyltransferase (adenine-specific) n=1 Tax=Massilia genomosp. 1 TaxID=2609280 RepID=A0ABX0N2R5_9BURK|nr:site-specific DNA-methyltransferase [Massilia genomosp. 1]NHZ66711.1 site-specific DNA-methyltransferase [Massilia genomosp. 1]